MAPKSGAQSDTFPSYRKFEFSAHVLVTASAAATHLLCILSLAKTPDSVTTAATNVGRAEAVSHLDVHINFHNKGQETCLSTRKLYVNGSQPPSKIILVDR